MATAIVSAFRAAFIASLREGGRGIADELASAFDRLEAGFGDATPG